ASRELEARVGARSEELQRNVARRDELRSAIAASERQLDEDVRAFGELKEQVRTADEASQELRAGFESQELRIREARRALEGVREEAGQLEVQRATAESDLSHLSASCIDTVQAAIEDVALEVARMEADGLLASPRAVEDAPEPAELEDGADIGGADAAPAPAAARTLTPDEMVADLRAKI